MTCLTWNRQQKSDGRTWNKQWYKLSPLIWKIVFESLRFALRSWVHHFSWIKLSRPLSTYATLNQCFVNWQNFNCPNNTYFYCPTIILFSLLRSDVSLNELIMTYSNRPLLRASYKVFIQHPSSIQWWQKLSPHGNRTRNLSIALTARPGCYYI